MKKMAKVIRLLRDKLIKVVNPDDSSVDCISAEKLFNGKIQVVYSKKEFDIDTFIHEYYADTNFSTASYFEACATPFWTKRPIILCPKNAFLHIYCYRIYPYDPSYKLEVEVYEVDSNLFEIETVTWNTQPPLGDKIYKFIPSHYGWDVIPTGEMGAIELVSIADPYTVMFDWYSTQYENETYRPFFTDSEGNKIQFP